MFSLLSLLVPLPQLLSCSFFPVQCPAHEVRFDSTGVILSPGFPENYPNLQMCSWLINVEKGYNITLHFELFQTEKEFDILEIFDGESLVLELIVIFLYILFPYPDIFNFLPQCCLLKYSMY